MREAHEHQHQHAPGKPGTEWPVNVLRTNQHDGEAHAEQQGEQLVELTFDERPYQPADRVIQSGQGCIKRA